MISYLKLKTARPKTQPLDLLDQALQALTETTGLHGQRREGRADAAIRIANGNKHWDFAVELRQRLTSVSLGAIVAELRKSKSRGMIVTHHVTLQMAEKLRSLDVPFLDVAGNAFLNVPGLFVFVSGKRMTEAHPADKNFSRAASPPPTSAMP